MRRLERAIVSGIENAPVSYWPIFSVPSLQSQKPLWKLTQPNLLLVSKMANCIEMHPETVSQGRELWPRAVSIQQKFRIEFRKLHVPNGTVHSGCTDPTQTTTRFVIVLVSRIQKSGTGNNNFVKWKGTFNRNDRTGQSGPPSKVIPNILVRQNRNGPFHLISYRNFQNFRLNRKCPQFPA